MEPLDQQIILRMESVRIISVCLCVNPENRGPFRSVCTLWSEPVHGQAGYWYGPMRRQVGGATDVSKRQ